MPITELFQDFATIGTTEYFLAADSTTQGAGQSTDGAIQAVIELNNLVAGDVYRIRLYESVSAGGTARVVFEDIVRGPRADPNYITPTILGMHKWDFSVTKIAGTDRSIAWSIRSAG